MRRPLLLLVAVVLAFPARAAVAHAPEPGVTAMVGRQVVAGVVWLRDDRDRDAGLLLFVAQTEGAAAGVAGAAAGGWFEAMVRLNRPFAPPRFNAYRGPLSASDLVIDSDRARATVRLPLGQGVAELTYAATPAAEISSMGVEVSASVTSSEHDHDWAAYMNSRQLRHAGVSGTALGFGVADQDHFGEPFGFIIATNEATVFSDPPRMP